jgi:NTP pyrophosphatase (non-canonical NTP hydrolase)
MEDKYITTIRESQELLRYFAQRNNWKDAPNIDKFDHLHEELIEMSQHLRYKPEEERVKFVQEHREIFIDGIGDLYFGLCRLANQLEVDIEGAFNQVKKEILKKYPGGGLENNLTSQQQTEKKDK